MKIGGSHLPPIVVVVAGTSRSMSEDSSHRKSGLATFQKFKLSSYPVTAGENPVLASAIEQKSRTVDQGPHQILRGFLLRASGGEIGLAVFQFGRSGFATQS